ncbi:molecular chaperone HtpG [Desulfonatronum thioautotrophicum]|uniref:molecular chaperone HtpG n=1 Tax=Desulfonatronum thioautotrophicum TaxID=617001 RepID=UPI000AD4D8AB|nr:molecular chaperone HtpG [Desulfonatronum thioautotrophicum]
MDMNVETAQTPGETREFQAEVKKILDIVINSLYTEREIFLRELISNSADALERYRHQSLTDAGVDAESPLQIQIAVDKDAKALTITDTGIGMDRGELETNLGTIAHSGTKTFLSQLAAGTKDVNLIGQFGVGFYAAFMVATKVRVSSRSFRHDDTGHVWESDGGGVYTITAASGLPRGTSIVLELKEDAAEFADPERIKRIIKQYSSFVPFPILVDGEAVNTVQALWTKSKSEISDEEYTEFYKFVGNAFDEPLLRLHFDTDAPLAIKALLFVPKDNFEKYGLGRTEPGVNLYCQRVLIEQHSKTILPEWLRFLKGVIDSEDLPLNISRQALQDSSLVRKINSVVTKRFLKHLEETAKNTPETYETFWGDFGYFLKEGVVSDFGHRESLGKLLRFESSTTEPGKLTSLADYLGRMKITQKEIYYIHGSNREAIEAGPYIEAFRKRNLEVIYTMDPIDDFVMGHLAEFEGKKLVSADRGDIELPELDEDKQDRQQPETEQELDKAQATDLAAWMKGVLGDRVKEVKESKRLEGSPAMIVNPDAHMTSSMERVMRAAGRQADLPISAKDLEINARHPLIKGLASLRQTDEFFARTVAEQILDNAMVQAGLLIEPRNMVERTYRILERAVGGAGETPNKVESDT